MGMQNWANLSMYLMPLVKHESPLRFRFLG